MNRKLTIILIFVCIALAGLTSLVSLNTSNASSGTRTFLPLVHDSFPLPDLRVDHVWFNMRGYTGGCVPEYGQLVIVVCAWNAGQADAGPFEIAVYGAHAATMPGLKVGIAACVETNAVYSTNPVTVVVDSANQVAETDEGNNTWVGYLPVPTPPALCTATPTPTVTPSPVPSPTMTPTVSCIRASCS